MVQNYGQLWREGKLISTAFIESLVNCSSGSASPRSSRCSGPMPAPISCSRRAARPSTASSPQRSVVGIPTSRTTTARRRPRSTWPRRRRACPRIFMLSIPRYPGYQCLAGARAASSATHRGYPLNRVLRSVAPQTPTTGANGARASRPLRLRTARRARWRSGSARAGR